MSNSIQLRFFQDRCGCLHSMFYVPALPIVFTLFVLLQSTLLAQAPGGVISGVVDDVTGALVKKASLRVTQPQFGGGRVVETDAYGQYYITNLEPGDYEIEAVAPGFKTDVQNVRLLVGDQLTVNFQLHPGSVLERVLVSGQTSGVNTSEFAVNGSVSQVQIQNLPLNGRNFLELARLEPGVSVVSVANPGTFANNYSRVSIAGAQYLLTHVSVDGATVDDRMNGGAAQNFSQESAQEFQVERFTFDPASGMTSTGGINIVSRHGNNNLHGAGFFFYRDHNMAAYPGFHR